MMIARKPLDHLDAYSEWHNENVELSRVTYNGRLPGEATGAEFDRDGKTGIVTLYLEDRNALQRAGYTIKSGGVFEPTLPLVNLEWTDKGLRLREIKTADMLTWQPIRRRNEARADVVNLSATPETTRPVFASAPAEAQPETQPAGNASLYMKMARVMGKLSRLPKNGWNKHFEYAYVSEADIADAVRAALSEIGIAFFSEIIHYERKGETITRRRQNGGEYEVTKYTTYLQLRFTFACTDTGATIDRVWFSEADDDQDKGISKAVTLAQKYFLKSVFIIGTGDIADDPDAVLSKQPRRAQPASQQQRQAEHARPNGTPAASAQPKANTGDAPEIAPANLILKVKQDAGVKALKEHDYHVVNTINKVWRENGLSEDETGILGKLTQLVIDHLTKSAGEAVTEATNS